MGRTAAVLIFGMAVGSAAAQQSGAKAVSALKIPVAKDGPLTARERSLQVLNRFAYGPRPGDVDHVTSMGVDKWLEQQMDPGSVPDGATSRRMADYPTLSMIPGLALETYPDHAQVEQVAEGKRPMPDDPLRVSEYEGLIWKYNQEVVDKLHPRPELTPEQQAAKKKADQTEAARVASVLLLLPKKDRMAALNAMPVADRVGFAENVGGEERPLLVGEFSPREREVINAWQNGVNSSYRTGDELAQARVVRAIVTERQVQAVMTEFWFNHFNVFMPKDSDEWYTTSYERDTIRPHVFGKFRELLLATAESPAMMVYLDNWLSIGPDSVAGKAQKKGLNENYGREVMELHTVGVGGGYTQADVTALAAILTGWSVDRPGQGGAFVFDAKKHEPGTKNWFGFTIDDQGQVLRGGAVPPGAQAAVAAAPAGMKQGVAALSLLAASPKTAHFVSYLLCQRFVSDQPPAALVDRLTATYLATDGDLKAMLRLLVGSAEFNSRRYYRTKVKMPEEFVASAFRATATDPTNAGALVSLLRNALGEPLYKALPPTGYYVTADHWMNTQALMARLNFSDQLTHGRFAGQKFDGPRVLGLAVMAVPQMPAGLGSDAGLKVLEGSLIGGELSAKTEGYIRSQMTGPDTGDATARLNLMTALLLGSPEFQLR